MQRHTDQYRLAPFHIFIPLAMSSLIYSFFRWGDNTVFQIGKNCFVIPSSYFLIATSFYFMGKWAVYELVHKDLFSPYLTWLHVITSVLLVVLLSTSHIWHDSVLPKMEREFSSWKDMREQQVRESKIYLPIAASFLTGQTAFIANLVLTFVGKNRRTRKRKTN